MERIVLHLDIDYFFAQAEENEHPEYRGKPVVVCVYSGRTAESGVVSTANYEARGYGVRSGMPIRNAIEKLKGAKAVFLPVRHELYGKISQGVMETLSAYGEKFEYASIDEGYLDLTRAADMDYAAARKIGERIKNEILAKFHLTCSVGVGPNKLIAKIASEVVKPNGLTVVASEEVGGFLEAMDVTRIPGVGKKSSEFLENMGIKTVSQLRKADPGMIAEAFGKKTGGWLINAARGVDESEVGEVSEQKQISRIATLKRDTRELQEIMGAMEQLIHDVANEINERNVSFSAVGAALIDENLKNYAKARTLAHPSQDPADIRKTASALFQEILNESGKNFRRAGIRIERLESKKGQKTLGEF
ncbi:DNA polymerase IV [uncultured archaeon]|nr:DNA polymerase IV [uncultured archaeon]